MRVLFISHYSKMYGANKSLLQLIVELKNNFNINPLVLIPQKGELELKLKSLEIDYIIVPYFKWVYHKGILSQLERLSYRILNKLFYKKILEKVKNYKIDLIHTNSSVINIGAELSKKLKIPHIWHIREYCEEDYNLLFDLGYEKAGKYMENHSNKIIAISNSIKDKYSKYMNNENIKLIYNGINISQNKAKSQKKSDKINFVLIGVLHKNKNQLDALKAIKILKEKYKKDNFILNIIGDGKLYKNKLIKYVKENSLEENTNFLGYIENVDEILEKMDVGILTSKKEAFGRVTIEMMLHSLPVIGTNSGGTIELINHECGFLYDVENSLELAEYMNKFIENKKLKDIMGKKSRERALENFTSIKNTEKIYNLYREVLLENIF